MHLKSLTLRGFKSFASSTTLRFEPGITCVVGPNGSGKSNVVDAIAWVLGEQGAKSLRGGKMEDVIFAGTAGRPPLGRAEVVLTIDNADAALPIDYTEVTISRLMYRSGQSEYAINGNPCRLLDVQELLSDSGIGRELHVLVGQGRLDPVLSARPEDRRGLIEEAAGVLKHRKRKEKALRKLEAMQANLTRLTDLTAELNRQLGPLGRQAELARRAAGIQADLRYARLRLLADDLATLQAALDADRGEEERTRARRADVEAELATVAERERAAELALAGCAPRLAAAVDTHHRLTALGERLAGLHGRAAERLRAMHDEPDPQPAGREPADLEREAAGIRAEESALAGALARDRAALAAAVAVRVEAEQELAAAEGALVAAVRAVADRREGLARLAGQVGALRTRAAAAQEEIGRLADAERAARRRAEEAQRRFAVLETSVTDLDEGEAGLDEDFEAATACLADAEAQIRRLEAAAADADRRRWSLLARREALELALARKDGAAALLAAPADLPGLLGPVAGLVTVQPGAEAALAAALGPVADAVAVADPATAAEAVRLLRARDAGRAGLLVAAATGDAAGAEHAGSARGLARAGVLPAGAVPAADLVTASPDLGAVIVELLGDVVVVDDIGTALDVVGRWPALRAATRDGDLVGSRWASGGPAGAASLLEIQAAIDTAGRDLDGVAAVLDRTRFDLARVAGLRKQASRDADAALDRLHESDARHAAVAEDLAQLGTALRSALAQADGLARARADAEAARDRDLAGLAAAEARLAAAEAAPDAEPDPAERDAAATGAATARGAEMEARLAVRTAEERVRGLSGGAEALERTAAAERAARAAAERRRAERAGQAARAGAVLAACQVTLSALQGSVTAAARERAAVEAEQAGVAAGLVGLRDRRRMLAAEAAQLMDLVHREEVVRAEQRMRRAAITDRAMADFGVPEPVLLAEYGPHVPVPVPGEGGDAPAQPYRREEQERRARDAERALARLGRVNPLALEEYQALQERHQYLAGQLADITATRRDLLGIVREVDERVQEVFAEAFADTAREFAVVFARLFPGGTGRLSLTDPDDLLGTGIEVEARPAGKKVSRLSLLSGGERSLVAVALLVAIFRARPSPFYVLDEVEAALDDRNLGRLVDLLEELRATSQLIVVTHQKRTMEVADALYGVAMRGDGITEVISQRLRDQVPA